MEERLKVVGTAYRNCFGILPTSIRDKIISSATSTSLSGSIVVKLKWSSPVEKISFIGCRGDKTCEEGYIQIPINLLQCINLSENILVTVTFVSSTTSYSTTQLYETISLKPSSYEDWEIIQYNSQYVADNLLRQIDIINDKDSFPIYIGDIKVHLQSNMNFRWGFLKLGNDTTIDIMPLKRSAKKNKKITTNVFDDSDDINSVQSKDADDAEDKEQEIQEIEHELCRIFRIGSFNKYVNDILPIPPNNVVIAPNDEFYDGDNVIVTFRNNKSPETPESKEAQESQGYTRILMRLISCDYIENSEIVLLSQYDINCYGISTGDFCVIESMKLNENYKHISLVSPLNELEFITIHLQQILIVSSNIITSASASNQFNEFNNLYLDNTFKLNLIQYLKQNKYNDNICNNSIITYNDLYFHVNLTTNGSQLKLQLDDNEILYLIAVENISDNYINIMDNVKHFAIINHNLLPPVDNELIQLISTHIMNCNDNNHVIMYGNDARIRLQYVDEIMNKVNANCNYPISFIKIDCNLYINSRIAEINNLFDDITIESKQLSPAVIIFYDLDKLIPFQSNETINVLSMRSFQIGHKLLKCIENINKNCDNVLIISCITDPSCLDIHFLSLDIFHTIFCLNMSENKAQNKSQIVDKQHLNNNLKYLYSYLAHKNISFSSLKTLILNHGNKWFKYASYHDIKLFIDQCMIEYTSYTSMETSMADIIIKISSTFIPPTMRETYHNNNKSEREESWDDIGGLSLVKQELLDIFETPTKYNVIFNKLSLAMRTGVLLYGPSGCGKTMIGKCIADRCGLNIIRVKGPELLNKYIGASESAIRDVFIRAKQNSPCIIFFDEFESIVPLRGKESTGVTDRIVNQLLTFLDGVESQSNVFVLAASSRPDLIDSALLRPGRLDKKLFCPIPTQNDRKDIITKLIENKKIKFSESLDDINQIIELITKETQYFTGADLNMIFTVGQTNAFHRCKNKLIEMKIQDQDHAHTHFEVAINYDDLNDAIKETKVNVNASMHQQKQQGLSGTFKNQIDLNTVGLKSMQY